MKNRVGHRVIEGLREGLFRVCDYGDVRKDDEAAEIIQQYSGVNKLLSLLKRSESELANYRADCNNYEAAENVACLDALLFEIRTTLAKFKDDEQ